MNNFLTRIMQLSIIFFILIGFFIIYEKNNFVTKTANQNHLLSNDSKQQISNNSQPNNTLPTQPNPTESNTIQVNSNQSNDNLQPADNPQLQPTDPPSTQATDPIQIVDTPTPADLFSQVNNHNNKSDCWVTYQGHIYNITSYFGQHPGGDAAMAKYCGQDITSAFNSLPHSQTAASILQQYLIQ